MPGLIVFLIVLSVLIVVHELGHLVVARRVGIRVEKFSIGFGPRLLRKTVGQTEFCVSLLPLGGYVKLAGESPSEAKGYEWEFHSKSPMKKAMVVIAGPVMNAVLAFVLFAVIAFAGQPTATTKVGKLMDDMPAKAAGVLPGDKILAVNGIAVTYWDQLLTQIRKNPDRVVLDLDRGGSKIQLSLSPKPQSAKGFFGRKIQVSYIGVIPSTEVIYLRHSLFQSMQIGLWRLIQITLTLLSSLALIICGALPFKESMAGPIGIFYMTSEAAQQGILTLINFVGVLSVSLFVLNLLPIPVLDGGHLLFLFIEKIKGSPLSDNIKERMTQAGLVALMALMVYVIIQDVQRFTFLKKFVHRPTISAKGS